MRAGLATWDGASRQWKVNFDHICEGVLPEGERLSDAAIRYAQARSVIDWGTDVVAEPNGIIYSRRHSTGAFANPLSVIARSWERSIEPNAPPLSQAELFKTKPRLSQDEMQQTVNSGVIDAAWHWDHTFLDIPPFRWLVEKYQPEDALDIGCGIGALLALMRKLGLRCVLGIDGIPAQATVLSAGEYLMRDLATPLNLARRFALVVCTEVAEHMPDEASAALLATIDEHAENLVVFSAASVGQPGNGHINCRPIEDWLRRWQNLGWIADLDDTFAIRSLSTFSWLRRNLLILRRGNFLSGENEIRVLAEIGKRPFTWYGQSPGIRAEICAEELPRNAGYKL